MTGTIAPVPYEDARRERAFLSEIYRVAGDAWLDLSTSPQIDNFLRNPMISRYLSIQHILYSKSRDHELRVASKVAWTVLNIRYINSALSFAFKQDQGQAEGEKETQKPRRYKHAELPTLLTESQMSCST